MECTRRSGMESGSVARATDGLAACSASRWQGAGTHHASRNAGLAPRRPAARATSACPPVEVGRLFASSGSEGNFEPESHRPHPTVAAGPSALGLTT
jgi:hypothetical protein